MSYYVITSNYRPRFSHFASKTVWYKCIKNMSAGQKGVNEYKPHYMSKCIHGLMLSVTFPDHNLGLKVVRLLDPLASLSTCIVLNHVLVYSSQSIGLTSAEKSWKGNVHPIKSWKTLFALTKHSVRDEHWCSLISSYFANVYPFPHTEALYASVANDSWRHSIAKCKTIPKYALMFLRSSNYRYFTYMFSKSSSVVGVMHVGKG